MESKRKKRILIYGGLLLILLGFNTWYFTVKKVHAAELKSIIRKTDHKVCLLNSGINALALRISLIRKAKKSICIQTFIWTNDQTGRLMISELIKAAKRGVQVRIIADQMFSETDPEKIAGLATVSPNLKIKHYNPLTKRINSSTLEQLSSFAFNFEGGNQRMHNKLMVVDDDTAITGGRNIEDTYFDNARGLNFKDRDVYIEGPVVKDMSESFESYWDYPLSIKSSDLKDIRMAIEGKKSDLKALENNPLEEKINNIISTGAIKNIRNSMIKVKKVAFFADKPGKIPPEDIKKGARITRQFVSILLHSKKSILIQSPYLVFGEGAMDFFQKMTHKGIQLTASTNSLAATDSWPTYAMLYKQKRKLIDNIKIHLYEFKPLPDDIDTFFTSNQAIREEMLKKNVKNYNPEKPDLSKIPYLCLHAKSMVIDRSVGCVGSFNFDPRSANINTEVALVVWDDKYADLLASNIEKDMRGKNSWVVWKREEPLGIEQLNAIHRLVNNTVEGVTTIDLWPERYISNFELKEGKKDLLPNHPDFHDNYKSVGNFPMVPIGDEKEVFTRMFKAFGKFMKPIL